eukprot:4702760-Prymnesium_polylepis.2
MAQRPARGPPCIAPGRLQRARALEHTAHIRARREGRRTRRLCVQSCRLSSLGRPAARGEVGVAWR